MNEKNRGHSLLVDLWIDKVTHLIFNLITWFVLWIFLVVSSIHVHQKGKFKINATAKIAATNMPPGIFFKNL